jgi:hypothetical protein
MEPQLLFDSLVNSTNHFNKCMISQILGFYFHICKILHN